MALASHFLQKGGMPQEVEDVVIANGIGSSDDEGGEEVVENASGSVLSVNDRLKRKAKRPSLKFAVPKDLNRTKSDSQIYGPVRAYKNSRKSRNGHGRGLPKKGGAGGKGTWGALGSELTEEDDVTGSLDRMDPNYDDASLDNKDIRLKCIDLEKRAEINKKIQTIVLEYYDHLDPEEVLSSLDELDLKEDKTLVAITAIEVAMDHKPSHREMTSRLLADLSGSYLYMDDYKRGFDHLLRNIEDLMLDTPDAPTILGNFIGRAIADECVPPKFMDSYKGKMSCEHACKALQRASALLTMRHGLVRLDNVWGVGGGTRAVRHLIKKIILLLEEFLSADDVEEAARCLNDLEVPHFHHEVVYEGVNLVLERMDPRTSSLMLKLFTSFCKTLIISPLQMKEGFLRIYEDLPQISLDVPQAYGLLESFVTQCQARKILDDSVAKKMPSRGRKRFVSEGDGGRVKDHSYY